MSTMGSPDISDVLELVRTWPPAMRVTLARKVLETLGYEVIGKMAHDARLDSSGSV